MSTTIFDRVDAFLKDMNQKLAEYRKELEENSQRTQGQKQPKIPVITFVHNKNTSSYMRTPRQHVDSLLKNRSWTFTSRHLSNSARHILIKIDGAVNWEVDNKETWKPYDFDKIKQMWDTCMNTHTLSNYKGKSGWGSGDPLHLELPNSSPRLNHPIVRKVIQLYVEETRVNGKPKNEKLERVQRFKRAIEQYEKKLKK